MFAIENSINKLLAETAERGEIMCLRNWKQTRITNRVKHKQVKRLRNSLLVNRLARMQGNKHCMISARVSYNDE